MKKIILMLALVFSAFIVTEAQQNNIPATSYPLQSNIALLQDKTFLSSTYPVNENDPAKDYNYYSKKSQTQRIIGLSLLGSGVAFGVIALLSSSNYQYVDYEDAERHDKTVTTLFILSAATGFASIPFMIMAHSSKNKARAAVSSQKTFIPGKGNKYITGLTISIPMGK